MRPTKNQGMVLILQPTTNQQAAIDHILTHLVRTRFEPLMIQNLRADSFPSEILSVIEGWFGGAHEHLILDHIIFHRYGFGWRYEIVSRGSPRLLAEEVLCWLRENYPPSSAIESSDRRFFARTLEIYEQVLTDHMVGDGAMDAETARQPAFKPDNRFFESMAERLRRNGYPKRFQVDTDLIVRVIDEIERQTGERV